MSDLTVTLTEDEARSVVSQLRQKRRKLERALTKATEPHHVAQNLQRIAKYRALEAKFTPEPTEVP
jgi:hypothetical protein